MIHKIRGSKIRIIETRIGPMVLMQATKFVSDVSLS